MCNSESLRPTQRTGLYETCCVWLPPVLFIVVSVVCVAWVWAGDERRVPACLLLYCCCLLQVPDCFQQQQQQQQQQQHRMRRALQKL